MTEYHFIDKIKKRPRSRWRNDAEKDAKKWGRMSITQEAKGQTGLQSEGVSTDQN